MLEFMLLRGDVKGTWRVDPWQLGRPFSGRTALLSPFDRLIHDRKRAIELFEFDYQLEITSPPPPAASATSRCRSSAVMVAGSSTPPPTARPGALRVDALHEDVTFTKTTTAAVHREIRDLAHWLQLDLVVTRAIR